MTERLSRKLIQERRDGMRARMVAEQARGWPKSPLGHWTGDMHGYVPLDEIPVRDIAEFGLEGLEPLAPGEEYLPERCPEPADMFEDMDKAERRQARRENFIRTGDTA